MRLLLLNNNPAVSRLIKLSAEKAGYELDEFEDYGLVPLSTYDVILVDNELYDEDALAELCRHIGCNYVVYICQRGAKKPESVNVALEKPFLPTDFLALLDKVKNVIASQVPEEEDEVSPSELSSQSTQTEDAFDIDQIDTLENDDNDMLPINLLEENDDDFKDDEGELDKKLSIDELGLDDASLNDLVETDNFKEELAEDDSFSFDDVEPLKEEEKELTTPFEDFDFEEADNDEPSSVKTISEDMLEDFSNPSILDKDDINEVKQLLDDDEDENEIKEISEMSLDALDLEKEEDVGTFFFEEDALKEEEVDNDALSVEPEDDTDLSFEDIALDAEDLEEENIVMKTTEVPEAQEEIIDDFAEEIEEKIEEEKEQALEEEELFSKVDTGFDADSIDAIDSLDDLNENMLKKAFGEESDEEEFSVPKTTSTSKSQDIEVIRDEIESSIARSISTLAQSDILREALKGMRLNISITFDEKE